MKEGRETRKTWYRNMNDEIRRVIENRESMSPTTVCRSSIPQKAHMLKA